jgi:uncharacterized protein (TIRG00374 family)
VKLCLKSAFGIALFAILLNFVDWRRSGMLLLSVALIPAALAVSMLTFGLFLSSLKWNILLRSQGMFLSCIDSFQYYSIGAFASNYLPSTIGGDIVRLSIMRGLGCQAGVAASIIVERVTGFAVLLSLSALALLMRPQYFEAIGLLTILWLIIASFTIGLILAAIVGRPFIDYLVSSPLSRKRVLGLAINRFRDISISLDHYRGKRGRLTIALVLSLLFYGSVVSFQYFLFLSLDLDVSLVEVCFIAPLVPLVSLLPASVNGVGLAEATFVLFYTQTGLLPEEAFAAALLRRLLQASVCLVGGIYWLRGKCLSSSKVTKAVTSS